MRVDPNIPIWLAQSITGFSEVERMYALNYTIHQLDPALQPSVYAFCLSYRPAFSREAQMLVDQLGYQLHQRKGAAMHGYVYDAPAMSGFRFHNNADASVAGNLASSCGLTRTPLHGGLGFFSEIQSFLQSDEGKAAVQTGTSIANALTQNGTPPPAGSQSNPTGFDMYQEAGQWFDPSQMAVPATPAAPAPAPVPKPPVPPVVVKLPMSMGVKIAIGVGVAALVGGGIYFAVRK
jgi:hypothetical protein